MSILLDSLRKSEAQRKIKGAPSIHSTQPYGGGRPHSSRWLPLAMAGLTAIGIAWFGWRQLAPPDNHPSQPVAVAEGAEESEQAPDSPPGGSAAEAERSGGRTPVEQLTQSGARQETAGGEAAEGARRDVTPSDRIASYAALQEPEPTIAPDKAEATQEQGPGYEMSGDPRAGRDAELDAGAIDELANMSREAPERSSTRGRLESAESEYISYWQLPSAWRNEMPELRITVLVYAEASEDRFLLINGERLREGDELEGGVVLEEIRRDGAVFTYRSRQFMVKS